MILCPAVCPATTATQGSGEGGASPVSVAGTSTWTCPGRVTPSLGSVCGVHKTPRASSARSVCTGTSVRPCRETAEVCWCTDSTTGRQGKYVRKLQSSYTSKKIQDSLKGSYKYSKRMNLGMNFSGLWPLLCIAPKIKVIFKAVLNKKNIDSI